MKFVGVITYPYREDKGEKYFYILFPKGMSQEEALAETHLMALELADVEEVLFEEDFNLDDPLDEADLNAEAEAGATILSSRHELDCSVEQYIPSVHYHLI